MGILRNLFGSGSSGSDWKKKIDEEERQQALTEKRQRDKEEAESRAKKQKIIEEKQKSLGERYKCHVCGKPAKEPGTVTLTSVSGQFYEITSDTHTSWDIPGDLTPCKICNEWTCAEHIYHGICKNCAEKL